MWVWMLVAAAFVCATAMAQDPARPEKPGKTLAGLVLPVAGAPLLAEMVEERMTKFSDGTSEAEVIPSKIFRDAEGRMRTETSLTDGDGKSMLLVQIMDRAAGFMAMLVPSEKQGARFLFPKQDSSQRVGLAFFGGPLIMVRGEKDVKNENLGKQTIDGIEYEGERITTTSKEQPSLVGVEERWFAKDLGLFALMKSSGPDEQSTAKLTKVDRRTPDPALFQIPADYIVQDLKDDTPPQ